MDHDRGNSRDEICIEFNLPKSTLYRIIKNKKKIRSEYYGRKGKLKQIVVFVAHYVELENVFQHG